MYLVFVTNRIDKKEHRAKRGETQTKQTNKYVENWVKKCPPGSEILKVLNLFLKTKSLTQKNISLDKIWVYEDLAYRAS